MIVIFFLLNLTSSSGELLTISRRVRCGRGVDQRLESKDDFLQVCCTVVSSRLAQPSKPQAFRFLLFRTSAIEILNSQTIFPTRSSTDIATPAAIFIPCIPSEHGPSADRTIHLHRTTTAVEGTVLALCAVQCVPVADRSSPHRSCHRYTAYQA